MTDTIVEQTECYTIALTTELGPAVPYSPIDHRDGNINHGFVDLRGCTDIAHTIPEAVGKPGLIELLRIINHPAAPIMSVGCENGVFLVDTPHATGPTCYIGSYIDTPFRDFNLNTRENNVDLARRIMRERDPHVREWAKYELLVQPMRHFFGKPSVNLELRIQAFGRSEEEAWGVFNAQCQMMANIFGKMFAIPP